MKTVGAGITAACLTALVATPAGAATEGDVEVVNTETVQVYVDPNGGVESQRVYEQLTLTGSGSAAIANPIEESGLRNLDGFSEFSIEDGVQTLDVDVDGVERLRSVSDYDGELPLDIAIEYRLDGELVEPADVVGADGELEVTYRVRNITAEPQEVTFSDGGGGTVTETVQVPIPIVGSLSTTVPAGFTEVASQQANMAGDGKGGTKLSFTMTLFPPIGSEEAEFGYTATIADGVVPASSVTALPVNPLQSPSFRTAGESYQAGSDTGIRLADGATEIDANLLRLRDGAAELLDGLLQLNAGAQQLEAGLAGEAAPGAVLLADGAAVLKDGLGQIDDGAGRLSDGAGRLSGGTGDALAGSVRLRGGLERISGGLDLLASRDKLPAALKGVKRLKAGVDTIIGQVGAVGEADTLIDGLSQLEGGAARLKGGLAQLKGDGSDATPGLVGAKGGVDQVKAGLDAALAPANGPGVAGGDLAELEGGLNAVKTNFCDTHTLASVQCNGTLDQLIAGVGASRTNLATASGGLARVSTGLAGAIGALTSTPADPSDPNLMDGALALEEGAGRAKAGGIRLRDEGLLPVQAGLADLRTGLTAAVAGVLELAGGAGTAYAGSGELADGLGRIDDGAGELSDGASRLADGTGDAADGSGRLADGAGDLADGLGDAADGSGRLADGLGQAAEGAPQLVDGAGRLSEEGMSRLIDAGVDTAQDYGKLYATMEAGAARANTERMAYGAPEGAQGLTAYTYELLGDDGEGGRNVKRGLGALALLGLGGGAFALRRRLV